MACYLTIGLATSLAMNLYNGAVVRRGSAGGDS
jgi:hypothetical protein